MRYNYEPLGIPTTIGCLLGTILETWLVFEFCTDSSLSNLMKHIYKSNKQLSKFFFLCAISNKTYSSNSK